MKKILLILSTAAILFSGCENFLDTDLLTQKTTANFLQRKRMHKRW